METVIRLDELQVGECGIVTEIHTAGTMRRRFLDMGLIEGTRVMCVGKSPAGDPAAYRIRGAVIAIRSDDGRRILVRRQGMVGQE